MADDVGEVTGMLDVRIVPADSSGCPVDDRCTTLDAVDVGVDFLRLHAKLLKKPNALLVLLAEELGAALSVAEL